LEVRILKNVEYLKIPKDRIAVIIGKKGETKKLIEDLTLTVINVDSKNHTVTIESGSDKTDPLILWKTKYVLQAIGRGFSPKNALTLLEEDMLLDIIDLDKILSTERALVRIKGRIIGENGKTRRLIEELSETRLSIYGDSVAVIGTEYPIRIAKHAIMMLVEGASHNSVYRYLNKKKQELKQKRYELWDKFELKENSSDNKLF
jgi:ribosomal RNA assembly protein